MENVAFVLGAGASMDYDYPLGGKLNMGIP